LNRLSRLAAALRQRPGVPTRSRRPFRHRVSGPWSASLPLGEHNHCGPAHRGGHPHRCPPDSSSWGKMRQGSRMAACTQGPCACRRADLQPPNTPVSAGGAGFGIKLPGGGNSIIARCCSSPLAGKGLINGAAGQIAQDVLICAGAQYWLKARPQIGEILVVDGPFPRCGACRKSRLKEGNSGPRFPGRILDDHE